MDTLVSMNSDDSRQDGWNFSITVTKICEMVSSILTFGLGRDTISVWGGSWAFAGPAHCH